MSSELTSSPLPPIFILSCGRSGSTLLRYIIDTHPDICCPPELGLAALCSRLRHVYYYTLGQASGSFDEAEKQQLVLAAVKSNVSDIMMSYANAKNKKRWCEKSPDNLDFLDVLIEVFPEAKYICLYRNCLDVIHSLLEVRRFGFLFDETYYVHRNPQNLVAAFAEYWSNNTEKLLWLERERAAQCFRVTYESLVTNPAMVAAQLFAFLEISWEESLLNNIFSAPHDSGHSDSKIWFAKDIYQTSLGKGSTLTATQVGGMLERVNWLHNQLGYPLITHDASGGLSAHPHAQQTTHTSEASLTVSEMFTSWVPARLEERRDKLQGIRATCKFIISDLAQSEWMIYVNKGDYQIIAQDDKADCTITVSVANLVDMAAGKLNPAEAYLHGKLHINGDLYLARIIGEVLFGA